jgi:hypothetical protein
MQLPRPLHLIGAGEFDFVEWCARRFEMTLRQMQINGGRLEIGMTEQGLQCGEIGAGLEQMSRVAVPPTPREA